MKNTRPTRPGGRAGGGRKHDEEVGAQRHRANSLIRFLPKGEGNANNSFENPRACNGDYPVPQCERPRIGAAGGAPAPRVLKMQSTWPASSTLQENFKMFADRVDNSPPAH